MIKLLLKLHVLALIMLAVPIQAANLNDAYVGIKKKNFKKKFSHLAVMPVIAVPAVALPEPMKQLITQEVLKKLTKSKFKLLMPQQVQLIQDRFTNLYPASEQQTHIAMIGDHTVRELFFRHPVDGLVSIQVLAVAAPFIKDKAEWAGTSQKVKHSGDGFMAAVTGKSFNGYTAASVIRVVISDRTGKPVYNWSGGIEVMMRRNGQKFEALPKDGLWQNEKRVLKAIKYVMKPI